MATACRTVCMLIYNYFPNPSGGAEKQCRLQSHELVRNGNRCYILTARSDINTAKIENDHGCKIVRIWTFQPTINSLLALKNYVLKGFSKASLRNTSIPDTEKIKGGTPRGFLAKSVHWLNTLFFILGTTWFVYKKRGEINVIHTHIASWNAGFAGWLGNLLNIPVICKVAYFPVFHEFENSIPFATLWRRWRLKIPYIALLPEMAKSLDKLGISKKNIHVIPNGVIIPEARTPVEKNKSVLYVANFSQGSDHKGFDILFKGWSIVCRDVNDAKLLIAGGGDKSPWEKIANELGCSENIEFLGYVQDIASVYKKAGLFVLPSRGEGMSNALLEAQSYGIPCVVSDIPGNREIVVDGKTGIVVSVDNPNQFADAVIEMITNASARVSMGKAARKDIQDNFSIQRVVKQVQEVYSFL